MISSFNCSHFRALETIQSNDKFSQDPIKKQLSFGQELSSFTCFLHQVKIKLDRHVLGLALELESEEVQKIITKHEFNHFDDYFDHISHYKTWNLPETILWAQFLGILESTLVCTSHESRIRQQFQIE